MEKTKDFASNVQKVVVTLLVLNLLMLVYVGFVKKDAYGLETLKVGGPENMALVQDLYSKDAYKAQQKSAIQQALSSFAGQEGQEAVDNNKNEPTPAATTSNIDKTKMDEIKANYYLEGNKNARITILEFSELLCPYCKRQSDSKVIATLLDKYPKDVNSAFMHFIVHGEPAQKIAQAAECAGSIGGAKAFHNYITKGFDLQDQSEAGMIALAKELGVSESKFKACITSDNFISKVTQSTQYGAQLFGVTGTPGNVIVDNEKGTFTLIAGAYPIEKFEEEINKILGK